ncbi:helix-turn-helix domain-containing protein [Dyella sp. GSA-30]|uniref:helix-turn-helix domain-containing protein n=1 Tax=Dyella sp. GSA-30 TaxID=2994496 RepID=UPI002492734A|nr:helix-turn-helix domain-containing protein [Dyella sp. GSA-30]
MNMKFSTSAQRQRLLNRLQQEPIDTISARRDLNIMMPAARIRELRDEGHYIKTSLISCCDDRGRRHQKIALYSLAEVEAS